jgi:hypothetical protein
MAHLNMISISFFLFTAFAWTTSAASPKATTLNGTYVGKNLPSWDQDAFLGIPYAQPPVGDLRFKWPQSLDSSFKEERTATEYGDSCMQYTQNWTMSEDCLSLNVIRPAGKPKKPLPVLYVSKTTNNFSSLTARTQSLDLRWWSIRRQLCRPTIQPQRDCQSQSRH